jgi:hypothetical protein
MSLVFKLFMSEASAERLFKLLKDGVVKIGFKGKIPIATSPTALGNITVNKQSYKKDDKLTFRVKLNPDTINFLIYNVKRIEIYRKPESALFLGLEPLATRDASEGQTDFELEWVAAEDGNSQDQFFAFVVPNIPPSLPLELGKVVPATGCTAAQGVRYCVTDLGWTMPHEINESGQVVGVSYNTSGQSRAFLW